jgi:hypothetical protein
MLYVISVSSSDTNTLDVLLELFWNPTLLLLFWIQLLTVLLESYTVVVLNTVANHFLTWGLFQFWEWWDEDSMFCDQKPLTCLALPPGFACAHLRSSCVGSREATVCQNHSWSGDQQNSHNYSYFPLGVYLVVQIHLACLISQNIPYNSQRSDPPGV